MRTVVLAALMAIANAGGPETTRPAAPAAWPSPARQDTAAVSRALHLLNRIGYGARPGDVSRVLELGIERYVEQQLNPTRISDSVADAYLRRLAVLQMSSQELGEVFLAEQRARRARQRRNPEADPQPMRRTGPTGLRRHLGEFQQAAVARAVLSERQLNEVMVDFWTNHFNVFLGKGIERYLMPAYIEEVVRPRAFGRFEDLLLATAQSPAMLFYLDNMQSVAPGSEPPQLGRMRDRRRRARRPVERARIDSALARAEQRLPRGLNENYARELLELHTLGVDGGYTQDDVVAVARVLTGWGIRRRGGEVAFQFNEWAHDGDEKVVLGRVFRAGGGMDEGLALLRFLAGHPSTMRFVSTKLCERFVADTPTDGCVDAGVHAWQRTQGDMRAVVRAIITSPDFWAETARGAKIKTPLEFIASAVRAMGATPDTTLALGQLVARLGQPLYQQAAPTGYPERLEAWVNAGALLSRFNLALAIAAGRAPGVRRPPAPPARLGANVERLVGQVNTMILNGSAGSQTLDVMRRQAAGLGDPAAAWTLLVGLALGSPEFQRQ